MPDSLSAYLDAMGVEQWVLRSAPEIESEAASVDAVDTPVEPAMVAACLADFPANNQGQYLIVCGLATQHEGQGSAFDGAPAELLNAMLGATQWPAQQCVLLADLEQLTLALDTIQPSIVVAMGEAASQAILHADVKAKRQTLHVLGSAKAIATYHPVQAQLDPKQYKRPIWEDLKLAMAEAV